MWTISNILSISRLFLVFPALWLLARNEYGPLTAVFFIASATDVLDGYFARRNNAVSEIGKILDPLFDKIFVASVVIGMAWHGLFPMWFLWLIIGRDILIFVAGVLFKRSTGIVLPSNYTGKATVTLIGFTMIAALFLQHSSTLNVMIGASVVMMLVSIGHYTIQARKELQHYKQTSGNHPGLEN